VDLDCSVLGLGLEGENCKEILVKGLFSGVCTRRPSLALELIIG